MTPPTNIDMDAPLAPHDPALYQTTDLAKPLHGLDQVHDQQIEQFHEEGYLAVENVFTLNQMQEARKAILDLSTGKNDRFNAERKVSLEPGQTGEPILRKLMWFCDYSPCLKSIRDDPAIHQVLNRLLRGKHAIIAQEMALQKLPGGREKPWHQDKSYFTQSLEALCIGVWIALDDATLENGCMRIIPGGHHHGPYPHFQRRDWQICDTEIQPQLCTGVPLTSGGCLIFNSMLPHGTPTNMTDQNRRALQYHYLSEDAAAITEQKRHDIWGGDGKNLTC